MARLRDVLVHAYAVVNRDKIAEFAERLKVGISNYIVDFQVLGKKNIFLDVIEDSGRNAQRVGELQDKT
jgi:hypothetical protein